MTATDVFDAYVHTDPGTLRGDSGKPYLVEGRCAHRRTQLSAGWVEGDCLRCRYHGWKYDETGQCIEQPGLEEEGGFWDKVKITSYPTHEYLGLIFTYMGEGDPPPFLRHRDMEEEGVLEVGIPEYWPCNYFNRLDNASDGAHMAWTHRESMSRVGRVLKTPNMREAVETNYGLRSKSAGYGQGAHYVHLHWPNTNQNLTAVRIEGSLEDAKHLITNRIFWRVPVNDGKCVSFVVDNLPLKGDAAKAYVERRKNAEQSDADLHQIGEAILTGKMRIQDIDKGMSLYKLFWIEDYVVQCGQGLIADRVTERPSPLDRGTLMIRKLYEREISRMAAGLPLKEWTEASNLVHDEPED
ncbi:MAG: hypothetical protein HW416_1945 [Chloroflexi bacterium]|nr:hypothetical protein [Chloroflexota bacterium]